MPTVAHRFALLLGVLGGVLLSVVLILAILLGYHLRHWEQAFPGVHFAGVDLQGLRHPEVDLLMQARLAAYLEEPITLSGLGDEWLPTAVQLGMRVDTAQMAQDALALGRSGGLLERILVPFQLSLRPSSLGLRLAFDDDVLEAYVETIAAVVDQAPVNADLSLDAGLVVSVAPTAGQQLMVSVTINRIKDVLSHPRIRQPVELAIEPLLPVLGAAELQAANALTSRVLHSPLLIRHT